MGTIHQFLLKTGNTIHHCIVLGTWLVTFSLSIHLSAVSTTGAGFQSERNLGHCGFSSRFHCKATPLYQPHL